MSRIFLVLSLIALIALTYACVDGLLVGDYAQVTGDFLEAQQAHRLRSSPAAGLNSPTNDVDLEFAAALAAFDEARRRAGWHLLVGTATALVALLVHCMSVTYFIGTNRWCKEVCQSYTLDAEYYRQSDQIKRRSFPWSLGGILLLLAIICTGPPSDPLVNGSSAAAWAGPHRYVSIAATILMLASFLRQAAYIRAHYGVIDRILEQVRRIRAEKGLDDDVQTPPVASHS